MYYLKILKNFIRIVNKNRSINEQFQVIRKISNTDEFELEVYTKKIMHLYFLEF